MMDVQITADKLVSVYMKIRDQRSRILRAYEEQDIALKAQQAMVSTQLLEIMKEVGATNIKTIHGTVSRNVRTVFTTNDWNSMYAFIKEHDAMHLMEQRISQGNMKRFMEDNPDQLPMGLNSNSAYTVSVRKAK
jgi:hypothetical protein